jgi:indole-3-glycerol phosphate synthase
MTSAVPDILSRIVDSKRLEVKRLQDSRRRFRDAVAVRPAIIAEVKKASPSSGVLAAGFDPAHIAATYASGGAAALSVLTDAKYFQGSLADLTAARAATQLPVLRKDFILDETQIAEAFGAGADAILLIAAVLDVPTLRRLRLFAETVGIDVLVEAHNETELDTAIESGATLLGVNNRDLHSFSVSLETSLRLAPRIPPGAIAVSESGIRTRDDVRRLMDAGYSGFLVGEHLMRAPDPAAALRELLP